MPNINEYLGFRNLFSLAAIGDRHNNKLEMKYFASLLVLSILISSCSTSYEVVNPFKNLGYSGDRLFPVKTNFSEFSFRIWISNSTSIDRVISISKDSAGEFQGKLIEYGKLFDGSKYKDFFRDSEVYPKDGFAIFKQRLDSLNLLQLKDKAFIDIVEHEPFSTYVIEIKNKGVFNTFRFDTYYPRKTDDNDVYSKIELFIFEQFDIRKRFKFKDNAS
jgi:hypothetical protein